MKALHQWMKWCDPSVDIIAFLHGHCRVKIIPPHFPSFLHYSLFHFFYYYECSCHLNLTCDFDPRPIICIIIHLQYINLTRLCMSLLQISYLFSHRCHRHRHRRLRGVSCTEHISTFDETRRVYEKKWLISLPQLSQAYDNILLLAYLDLSTIINYCSDWSMLQYKSLHWSQDESA